MKLLNKISLPKLKLAILTTIGLSFVFGLANQVFACGPFFPRYIYTPEDVEVIGNPFLFSDIDSFLNFNYGIITSGLGPRSLYVVYRSLITSELTQQEKEQLLLYYNREFYDVSIQLKKSIASWKEARKLVTEKSVEIKPYKYEDYSYYRNCLPDAFLTAANTLRERSKIYNSEELKIWLEGQDKVFSNCGVPEPERVGIISSALTAPIQQSMNSSEGQSLFSKIKEFFVGIFNRLFVKKPIEPERKVGIPEEKISPQNLLKYDQEYQTAADYFYKGDFDEAEKRFKNIADNQGHPWQAYSVLALGRTYIRKGQFEYEKAWRENREREETIQARNEQFEKAKTQFENILKDKSLSSVQEGAKSLLSFVNFRINPEKRLKDAEDILLISHNPKEIVNNLEDFSLLFPRVEKKYILENGGDLSQWIYIWKNLDQNNLELALKKYQQTKSLPWLLASLKLMTPNHPLRDEIIRESLKIPKDSPGYFTVNYYRLKFLIDAGGNEEETKRDLDSMLKAIPKEFPLVKNYFSDLRMKIAKDLKESLSYSMREVVIVEYEITSEESCLILIDKKVKQLFNELLPLKKWAEIASTNDIFSPEIMKQIRLITFARAVLLDDFGTAEKMANLLASNDSILEEDLSALLRAETYDEKKFAATLFILKYPRLDYVLDSEFDEILVENQSVKERDIYRRNWWCAYPSRYGYEPYNLDILKKFFSSEEIQKAKLENGKIYKIVAPNYLSEVVINYSLKNPNDPRVPEALHLSVKSTRSAECKDEGTSSFSQKAFQILHNNYPNNHWTNKTPYWY